MARIVVYQNGSTEFRIPAIEQGGVLLLELKCGLLLPPPVRIGELTLVAGLGCANAIAEINEAVYKFPEPDLSDFLTTHPDFQKAFHAGFEGLSPSKIIYFSKQLAEAAERLEIEKLERSIGEIKHE